MTNLLIGVSHTYKKNSSGWQCGVRFPWRVKVVEQKQTKLPVRKLAKLFLATPKLFWQLLLTAYQLKYLNRETQMSTQEDNLELTLFRFMSKITRKAAAMLKMFVWGILSFSGKATTGRNQEAVTKRGG